MDSLGNPVTVHDTGLRTRQGDHGVNPKVEVHRGEGLLGKEQITISRNCLSNQMNQEFGVTKPHYKSPS